MILKPTIRINFQYLLLALITMSFYSCKKEEYKKVGLEKVVSFGENKGNLSMFFFKPSEKKSNLPLVVVLHGCSQNAKIIAEDTDWNKLAEKNGFYVLYPEQKTINNISSCFNWFLSDDNEKGKGEVSSIVSMINYMKEKEGINAEKVFVTGMSAGGAMTMTLLACYPEIFNGGASFAGRPYKSELNILSNKTPEQLGNYVRNQNPNYNSFFPKLMIIQGKKDYIVNFENANIIETQWQNVVYENELINDSIYHEDFNATIHITSHYKNNELKIQKVFFDELGHQVPIDVGNGEKQGGKKGLYTKDVDYFSSYYVAEFFGILK